MGSIGTIGGDTPTLLFSSLASLSSSSTGDGDSGSGGGSGVEDGASEMKVESTVLDCRISVRVSFEMMVASILVATAAAVLSMVAAAVES